MKLARRYQQTRRAQMAVDTQERILSVAERLFAQEPFDRVSLASVAVAAGVSIPTVQRAFVNKEGLFAAAGARVRERVIAQRAAPPDDVVGAFDALLAHYECEGQMMWHLVKQEDDVPALRAPLADARALHRAWVDRVFAGTLSLKGEAERERLLDALVAATDLFVWKLLRIDLKRSATEVGATMKAMALAVAGGM